MSLELRDIDVYFDEESKEYVLSITMVRTNRRGLMHPSYFQVYIKRGTDALAMVARLQAMLESLKEKAGS